MTKKGVKKIIKIKCSHPLQKAKQVPPSKVGQKTKGSMAEMVEQCCENRCKGMWVILGKHNMSLTYASR